MINQDRITKEHFIGKTIKDIDFNRPDQVIFFFTDDTQATLETRQEIPVLGMSGFYGSDFVG